MTTAQLVLLVKPSLVIVLCIMITWPLMGCVGWALRSLPLKWPWWGLRKSRGLVAAAPQFIAFVALLVVAVVLVASVVDAATAPNDKAGGRPDGAGTHPNPSTMLVLLALVVVAVVAGIQYTTTSAREYWPAAIRLSPDLAPQSPPGAFFRATRRVWFLLLSYAGLLVMTISIVVLRYQNSVVLKHPRENARSYDALAIYTFIGLAVATLLAIGIGLPLIGYFQNESFCLLLLHRIRQDQCGTGAGRLETDRMRDPLGRSRQDLRRLAQEIDRISGKSVRRDVAYPQYFVLRASSEKIRGFLRSKRSLSERLPSDMFILLDGLGSALVGGSDAAGYYLLAAANDAFDADDNPVIGEPPKPSRLSRILATLSQSAEPTDKLLSVATRVGVLLIFLALIASGKWGAEKLVDLVNHALAG